VLTSTDLPAPSSAEIEPSAVNVISAVRLKDTPPAEIVRAIELVHALVALLVQEAL
jgi:hypothetical protein